MGIGVLVREKFLFWHFPLTRYHIALRHVQRIFNKIRFFSLLILGLNAWIWGGFFAFWQGSFNDFIARTQTFSLLEVYRLVSDDIRLLFWLGVIFFAYAYYRSVREHEVKGTVEHHSYSSTKVQSLQSIEVSSWAEALKISHHSRLNIAETFTEEATAVLGEAYRFADRLKQSEVLPEHLALALLATNRVSNIFIRLGIFTKDIQKLLIKQMSRSERAESVPYVNLDFQQILFYAYEKAYEAHQDYVSVTEVLLATVEYSPFLQDILYELDVDKQKLINVVEWARIRERLYREYSKLRRAAASRPKTGIDKAMTAVATPMLNQFSEDLTLAAQFGRAETCVAREQEFEEIFRVMDGGERGVLLIGEQGVGKRTIIDGIATRMVEEDVPKRLQDKRLVRLSTSSLLAGTTPAGAVERLIRLMHEIARAGNIVLVIVNIHELIGVSAGGKESLDVSDTLAEYLSKQSFLTIATTTPDAYARVIARSGVGSVFTPVEIQEVDENQAIQIVESKVGYLEYKQQIFFSYSAVAKTVELAKRFFHEAPLPGSAIEILSEAAIFTRNKKGVHTLVTQEEVGAVVAEKTHIPVTTISSDESTKLLRLEQILHERVIGQDEAVSLVANALRRARAEIRSSNRPIANFLFLGPTGVGKTELAKTIAEVYFGGENRMIRLDMSEYQDKTGIYRLIGAPGEQGTGILTEAVRRNPFSLVLLDELEKADKDILNLFLQVMDDGRLTDSTGRVVDFTNVILIATSNAGTSYVAEQLRAGLSSDVIKDRLLHGELNQYFRPEFLNRFDGIVLFKPLAQADIKRIAALMLVSVAKDLEAKGVELRVEDTALEYFSQIGFDPEFGARPLRRVIQEHVENKLAELVLSNQLKRKDLIVIGENGEMRKE
jgi:ATP-dependent Clp protease ATP-binding subunit ClpC